jgi:invasion protein IalB
MVTRHIALMVAMLLMTGHSAARAESTGSWQVACYGEGVSRSCEATQVVSVAGTPTPLAQAALGWLNPEAALLLTIVVAPDVSLAAPLTLMVEGQAKVTLPWTRCRPSGCFAGAELSAAQVELLRAGDVKGSARLSFTDGSEADLMLRLPLGGIGAAIDRLEEDRGR